MVRIIFSRYRLLGAFVGVIIIYTFLYKSIANSNKGPSTDASSTNENLNLDITDIAYFEISISNKVIGKFTVGLFGNVVPKTVKNFVALTQGFQSVHLGQEVFISYKGSKFHRVIKNFMIQGGIISRANFSGTFSLYGESFPDENFLLKHDSKGWVSMANHGPDTNGCQFFITLEATPWLNDKHVVFGKILDGMDVINAIGNVETSGSDSPSKDVVISDCGIEKPLS